MGNFHADDFVSDSDLSDPDEGKAISLSKTRCNSQSDIISMKGNYDELEIF